MGDKWEVPKGVQVRKHASGETVSIRFRYHGVQCRELSLPASKENIRRAAQKLAAVQQAIEFGTFKYADHFPGSKMCIRFGEHAATGRTFGEALDEYIERAEKTVEGSTFRSYKRMGENHLRPAFGSKPLRDLGVADLVKWIEALGDRKGDQAITMKTIRNICVVLRNVLDREATVNRSIPINPMHGIKIRKLLPVAMQKRRKPEPEPFDQAERIALSAKAPGQWANMLQVWWECGLRASEIIALKWTDVDFVHEQLAIERVLDDAGEERDRLKTSGSRRTVRLTLKALGALQDQKAFTWTREDGFVFVNPVTGGRWNKVHALTNFQWKTICKRAGVRYRGPNQCRHTYAAIRITRGDNLWDIAEQMGHTSPEMLYRHYGSLIREAAPGQANGASARSSRSA